MLHLLYLWGNLLLIVGTVVVTGCAFLASVWFPVGYIVDHVEEGNRQFFTLVAFVIFYASALVAVVEFLAGA